jgi:dTMP kinase
MGLSRVGRRGSLNRLDQEEIDFHQRVREGYLTLAKENPQRIHLLSGAKSPEASHKEIMAILAPYLERYRSTKNNV